MAKKAPKTITEVSPGHLKATALTEGLFGLLEQTQQQLGKAADEKNTPELRALYLKGAYQTLGMVSSQATAARDEMRAEWPEA